MLLIVMSKTSQKSISIDDNQRNEILQYMEFSGIKSFSAGVFSLIHRGLQCTCSISNHGGGGSDQKNASSGEKKKIPECIGKPGWGFCEKCDFNEKCAIMFADKQNLNSKTIKTRQSM